MSGLMYAQMGMAAISTYSNYSAQKHESRMREIQKNYHNTMVAMSETESLNTLTENEIATKDAFKRAEVALEITSLHDSAEAELNAAVAGVRGGVVDRDRTGLARSKLTAQFTLQRKKKAQMAVHDEQYKSIKLNAIQARDNSVIPKPNVMSAALGLGTNLLNIYDQHQPEGSKVSDHLSRL